MLSGSFCDVYVCSLSEIRQDLVSARGPFVSRGGEGCPKPTRGRGGQAEKRMRVHEKVREDPTGGQTSFCLYESGPQQLFSPLAMEDRLHSLLQKIEK